MIAGHFGLAAAVKSRERAVPLWLLFLACQWLDVLFVPLLALGVERMQPVPGAPAYGGVVIHADYTHSLGGAAVLSALFGALWAWRYGGRSGIVLALVSFSHWILDVPMHRGDMPLLPGNLGDLPRLGFGLWRSPAGSALLELALVIAGSVLYWRAAIEQTQADPGRARRARICGAGVLIAGLVTLGLNVIGQ